VESSFVVKAVLNFSISRLKPFSVPGSIADSLSYWSENTTRSEEGGGRGTSARSAISSALRDSRYRVMRSVRKIV
jgi:hypothetical protein